MRTAEACSGHGAHYEDTGYCMCDKGWGGPNCDNFAACGPHGTSIGTSYTGSPASSTCICDNSRWWGNRCQNFTAQGCGVDGTAPWCKGTCNNEAPQVGKSQCPLVFEESGFILGQPCSERCTVGEKTLCCHPPNDLP